MGKPRVITWSEAPELATPEPLALLSDSTNLWLAYETTSEPRGEVYAVIRFRHVIDHHFAPISDEGIGEHPYASAGLQWYAFNEVIDSVEAIRWRPLNARHWVVTFKDNTGKALAGIFLVNKSFVKVSSCWLMSLKCRGQGCIKDVLSRR